MFSYCPLTGGREAIELHKANSLNVVSLYRSRKEIMIYYEKIHCAQIKLSCSMDNFRKMDATHSCHSGILSSSTENVLC